MLGNIAFRMEIAAVLAVAAVMTACEKGGETVENGSPECEAFLAAATEYGLYSDGVPVRLSPALSATRWKPLSSCTGRVDEPTLSRM